MFSTIKNFLQLAQEAVNDDKDAANILAANIQLGATPIAPEEYQSFENFFTNTTIDSCYNELQFNFYPFQSKLIHEIESNRISLILHARPLGITTLTAYYSLFYANRQDRQSILYMGQNYSWVREISRKLRDQASRLNILLSAKDNEIILRNGSRIRFQSAQGMNHFYGEHAFYNNDPFDLVVIDNANYIPNKWGGEIMSKISTTMTTKFVISSTAGTYNNLLHRLMQSEIEAARITLPWSVHPERDTKWVEEIKFHLGVKDFAQEYECQIVTEEKEA